MGRVSKSLNERSAALKEKQEWLASARAIEVLLLLEPENREQKVELAEILDRVLPNDNTAASSFNMLSRIIAAQARALGVCEADPSLKDREVALRRRMIQRLLQSTRYEDAMDQIAKLASAAIDPSLMKSLALCRYSMALEQRSHTFNDSMKISIPEWLYSASTLHVVDLLLKAIIENPGDIEISTAVAEICLGNPEFLLKSQLENSSTADLRDRPLCHASERSIASSACI